MYLLINALTVALIAAILICIVGNVIPKRNEQAEQSEEPLGEAADEPDDFTALPELTPQEEVLFEASRQAFQMNLDLLEAHQKLMEAVKRHTNDPPIDPQNCELDIDAEWSH